MIRTLSIVLCSRSVLLLGLAACAVAPIPSGSNDESAQTGGTKAKGEKKAKSDLGEGSAAADDDDASSETEEPTTSESPTEPEATEAKAATCPKVSGPVSEGHVDSKEVEESSGIVVSTLNPDVYWVHNDSGDAARVFAVDKTGTLLTTLTFDSAKPSDIEDIAIEDGPDGSFLYLADIGDNGGVRSELVIHRVAEPKLSGAKSLLTTSEKMRVRYPNGSHNAETLLFDPTTKDLLIATKVTSGNAEVHRIGAFSAGASVTTTKIAEVDAAVATGGDISRDGKWIALRSYGLEALLWSRTPGESLAAAFARQPCRVPVAPDDQAEAIAFLPNGSGYVTIAEGKKPSLDVARFE